MIEIACQGRVQSGIDFGRIFQIYEVFQDDGLADSVLRNTVRRMLRRKLEQVYHVKQWSALTEQEQLVFMYYDIREDMLRLTPDDRRDAVRGFVDNVFRKQLAELLTDQDSFWDGIDAPLREKAADIPAGVLCHSKYRNLVGYELSKLISEMQYTLYLYYATDSPYTWNQEYVERKFFDLCEVLSGVERVLSRVFVPKLSRLEDMVIAVYGVASDAVYLYRSFLLLCRDLTDSVFCVQFWKQAWQGVESWNIRLSQILGVPCKE